MDRLGFLKRLGLAIGAVVAAPIVASVKTITDLPNAVPLPEVPKEEPIMEEDLGEGDELLADTEGIDGFSDDGYFSDELDIDPEPIASSCATSQPYIISIENKSTTTISNVQIFGSNKNRYEKNHGNPSMVEIKMGIANVTYAEMLAQSEHKPFVVGLTYLSSVNEKQLLEPITVQHTDANGNMCTKVIQGSFDEHQQQFTAVAIKNIYSVDGGTTLILHKLFPFTKITLSLYPTHVNISRPTLTSRRTSIIPTVALAMPKVEYFDSPIDYTKSWEEELATKKRLIK